MKKIMTLTLAGAVALFTASATAAYASSPACNSGAMTAGMNAPEPTAAAAAQQQDNHQDHHKMDKMTPKTGSTKSAKKTAAMNMQGKKTAASAKKKAINMKKKPATPAAKKTAAKKTKKDAMNMKDMDM